jgi:DHA1 family bicyclomycin/chloramphenicol resistance-like MFS transporter
MNKVIKPAIWLLILIATLPQFSETVYTPALPNIARYFQVSESTAEHTLSIYLLGMAIGTLIWGSISDSVGRKPCLLFGTGIFVAGCAGCFFSQSIESLMIYRFIQAFGGSTGSVLGQAIARDAFKGQERGKVFSLVGGAIFFSPAIVPVLGGFIDELFGWSFIFAFLGLCGFFVWSFSYKNLVETRVVSAKSSQTSILSILKSMVMDKKVIACVLIVGGISGIGFSYYSEGPFYLMNILGLTPKSYGATFIFTAISGFSGALYSKRLHGSLVTREIIKKGLSISFGGSLFFVASIFSLYLLENISKEFFILVTIISMMAIIFGMAMTAPNVLSIALTKYEYATGTASSFLGFFYYIVAASVTFFMGILHNGALFPMPLYFLFIMTCVLLIFFKFLKKE